MSDSPSLHQSPRRGVLIPTGNFILVEWTEILRAATLAHARGSIAGEFVQDAESRAVTSGMSDPAR